MAMLCRSGRLVLTLMGCLAFAVSADDLPDVVIDDWRGHEQHETLRDGSVLTEYSAGTEALRDGQAYLRVGFIPRFGCSPLVTLVTTLRVGTEERRARSLDDFAAVDFEIDGPPIDFPILVDDDSSQVTIYYNGNLQRRIALRLHIDVGDQATVTMQNGEELAFSLLGSRESLETVQELCREHTPVPIE